MQTRHTQTSTVAHHFAPAARPAAKEVEKPAAKPVEKSTANPGEKTVEFYLKGVAAKSVLVAGTFNNWDPKRTPMRKEGSGGWKLTLSLSPGRYEYRFVADGQWLTDPAAQEQVKNPFGGTNAVVVV